MGIVATEIQEYGYSGGGDNCTKFVDLDMDLHNHVKASGGEQAKEGVGYQYQLRRFWRS